MDNEDQIHFGHSWDKVTLLTPLVAIIMILMALALLLCPRKYAVWPFIAVACFVVPYEHVVIADLMFNMLRLLTVIGFLRVLLRNEVQIAWKPIDTAMTIFSVVNVLFGLVYSTSEFTTRAGASIDSLGTYLLFRLLIRNWNELFNVVRGFIYCGIPVAGFFIVEHFQQNNLFAAQAPGFFSRAGIFVGDRYRAQGAFSHPILAGCFWATMMPLMGAMWWRGSKARIEGCIGLFVSFVIVVCCASSTPVASLMFGIIGASLFFMRRSLAWLRWGVIITLIVIHLTWDKPVWAILTKADLFSGSTGYQRFQVIDKAIEHFGDWALAGIPKGENKDWGPNLKDLTNNYVKIGTDSGLGTLLLFGVVLFIAFYTIGKLWRRSEREHRMPAAYAAWALGVSLFCHCMGFLSVSYFGQIVMLWSLTLAMVGSVTSSRAPRRIRYRVVKSAEQAQPVMARPQFAQEPHGSM